MHILYSILYYTLSHIIIIGFKPHYIILYPNYIFHWHLTRGATKVASFDTVSILPYAHDVGTNRGVCFVCSCIATQTEMC